MPFVQYLLISYCPFNNTLFLWYLFKYLCFMIKMILMIDNNLMSLQRSGVYWKSIHDILTRFKIHPRKYTQSVRIAWVAWFCYPYRSWLFVSKQGQSQTMPSKQSQTLWVNTPQHLVNNEDKTTNKRKHNVCKHSEFWRHIQCNWSA